MPTTSDGVEVKLGADTGDAISGIAGAASNIKGSFGDLSATLKRFGDDNRNVVSEAIKNNANLSRSFVELKASTTGGFNAISGVIARFRGVLAGLTAVLAGGAIFKGSVGATLGLEEEVRGLSIVFGATSEKAAQMAVALKLAGVETGTYEMMAQRVGQRIATQGAEFDRLGVVTKDAAGNLLPMDQILQNVYQRMLDFKPGTDQLEFALTTVGRNARDFARDMERLQSVQQRSIQLQRELGISMSDDDIDKVEKYRVEVNAFKVTLEEIGVRIGEAVLPHLEELAQWFVSKGPSAIAMISDAMKGVMTLSQTMGSFFGILRGVLDAFLIPLGEIARAFGVTGTSLELLLVPLKIIGSAFVIVGAAINLVIEALKTFFLVLWDVSGILYNVGDRLAHFDFSGAVDAAKRGWEKLASDAKAGVAEIVKYNEDAAVRISNLWAGVNASTSTFGTAGAGSHQSADSLVGEHATRTPRPGSGKEHFTPKPTGTGGREDMLAQWKDQLTQIQEAEGYFHEFSKQQEQAYWQEKLAIVEAALAKERATKAGASQDSLKLERSVRELEFQAGKAAANEELQADLAKFQQMIDAAKNDKAQQISIAQARTATIKATFGEESKEYAKALDEETRLRQEWAAKDQALAKDVAKFHQDMAKQEIQGDQQALDQAVALRQISAEQKFAIEQQLENKLYDLDRQELENLLATLDKGTLAYQQTAEKIELLETQHQQKLTQIANEAELDRKQAAIAAAEATQSSFSTLLQALSSRVKTVKQSFLDFFKSIEQSLSKIASDQVAKQLFGPGTAGGGFLNNIFGKIFGGGASSAASPEAAAATALTGSATALTTSGSLLTTAATALQAAAAALSAGGAGGGLGSLFGIGSAGGGDPEGLMGMFAGGLPAFAMGTPYVPKTTFALVHKGEAIIPASMNRPGVGSSTGLTVNYSVNSPLDSRTQDQMATSFYKAAAAAMRKHS
jgi:hypothetical protein